MLETNEGIQSREGNRLRRKEIPANRTIVQTGSAIVSFFRFGAVFRTNLVEESFGVIVDNQLRIEVFRGNRRYHIPKQTSYIATQGNDQLLATSSILDVDDTTSHIELISRTKEKNPIVAREVCESEVDRGISLLSLLHGSDLFADPLYRGWILGGENFIVDLWMKSSKNVTFDFSEINYTLRNARINASKFEHFDRVGLMNRFYSKSLTMRPGEEKFLYLWTVLEIFPMKDTSDIKPISRYISEITGVDDRIVKEKLGIGRLFGLRSDLVHNGKFSVPLKDIGELFSRLESIVQEVMRGACGLPYAGSLDKFL